MTKAHLMDVYEGILNAAGMAVADDGCVSSVLIGDKPEPANVRIKENGQELRKRLVLPIKSQLDAQGGWDARVAFHPFRENILNSESDIVRFIREKFTFRVNMLTCYLIESIADYCLGGEGKNAISAKGAEIDALCSEATTKFGSKIDEILKKVRVTNTRNGFSSIYLKKNGTVKGEKYSCVCVISFPFYKQLVDGLKEHEKAAKNNQTMIGVFPDDSGNPQIKIYPNDIRTLIRIFEYLIPNIQDPDAYKTGLSSPTAPFIESLLHGVNKIAEPLNKVLDVLFDPAFKYKPKAECQAAKELFRINQDYMSYVTNIQDMMAEILAIPQLSGNEGKPEIQNKHIQRAPSKSIADIKKDFSTQVAEEENKPVSNQQSRWGVVTPPQQPVVQQQPVQQQQPTPQKAPDGRRILSGHQQVQQPMQHPYYQQPQMPPSNIPPHRQQPMMMGMNYNTMPVQQPTMWGAQQPVVMNSPFGGIAQQTQMSPFMNQQMLVVQQPQPFASTWGRSSFY